MLPRDSLREECIETLREAYSDVSLSRPDKFPIRTAIIRSQEAEWISPLLMQDIDVQIDKGWLVYTGEWIMEFIQGFAWPHRYELMAFTVIIMALLIWKGKRRKA